MFLAIKHLEYPGGSGRLRTAFSRDRADTVSYFYKSQTYLQPILSQLIDTEQDPNFNVTHEFIDSIYITVLFKFFKPLQPALFRPVRKVFISFGGARKWTI